MLEVVIAYLLLDANGMQDGADPRSATERTLARALTHTYKQLGALC